MTPANNDLRSVKNSTDQTPVHGFQSTPNPGLVSQQRLQQPQQHEQRGLDPPAWLLQQPKNGSTVKTTPRRPPPPPQEQGADGDKTGSSGGSTSSEGAMSIEASGPQQDVTSGQPSQSSSSLFSPSRQTNNCRPQGKTAEIEPLEETANSQGNRQDHELGMNGRGSVASSRTHKSDPGPNRKTHDAPIRRCNSSQLVSADETQAPNGVSDRVVAAVSSSNESVRAETIGSATQREAQFENQRKRPIKAAKQRNTTQPSEQVPTSVHVPSSVRNKVTHRTGPNSMTTKPKVRVPVSIT